MTDLLLTIGLSNACISLILAIIAFIVDRNFKRPHLAHLLWLLVFIKLLTPPLVEIPVITISEQTDIISVYNLQDHSEVPLQINSNIIGRFISPATQAAILESGKTALSLIWFLGSGFVLIGSLFRIYQFNRLLKAESEIAHPELQTIATTIARQLGLSKTPTIYTTSAHLSPMVWCIGGSIKIVIPDTLRNQMDTQQFKWILAHELAHVRRRDYMVRWLEWLTSVCFWWNPVVWWARHYLRVNEEICCDTLVVSSLKPQPHTYAKSLLAAVECLAVPTMRSPAMASAFDSYGFLEKRFQMIISKNANKPNARWLQHGVLLCAIITLPLSMTYASAKKERTADREAEARETDMRNDRKMSEDLRQQLEDKEKTIRKMDSNKDGKISEDERQVAAAKWPELFAKVFDDNEAEHKERQMEEKISEAEYKRQQMEMKISEAEHKNRQMEMKISERTKNNTDIERHTKILGEVYIDRDIDDNNKISAEERQLIAKQQEKLFKEADTNEDGKISKNERQALEEKWKKIAKNNAEQDTEDRRARTIKKTDTNDKERVNKEPR